MWEVKLVHLACALLTFIFFSIRGYWMLSGSPLLKMRVVRISPHIIDTCLLASGLFMAVSLYSAFYTQSWLMVKLLGVVLYIITGSIALKYGRTRTVRIGALLASWGIFAYIVMVALTRSPLPLA